ncbi:MAG: putative sulfate exporter family transporter [Magnetococcales bacterium]|nr:putative sulfate exporter family transporter [Magnetococcales bacterium]
MELLRGVIPLVAILWGGLALATGLSRVPLRDGSAPILANAPPQLEISDYFLKEDWWAIWLGLGLVVVDLATFSGEGSLLKALAIHPGGLKWQNLGELFAHFGENGHLYFRQFIVWILLFGVSCRVMGLGFGRFFPSFLFLYLLSIAIFSVSGWENAAHFNLEPPLVALIVGLVLANVFQLPEWMHAACRVEYYVKFGIVLLGATFPITLVLTAGPVAIGQATFISLLSCLTIYYTATRWFALDRRLAAVMSVGGSVCGVSASMAIAAAVGAKKEHLYTSVTLVVGWALVMIVALPFISQSLGLSPGVAGAWIGTSEFADAAGFAAASSYGKMAGNEEAAIKSFTLMKVIGRDIWIGIWSLVWAFIAITVWNAPSKGARLDGGEIWKRFPKFVLGFFAASILVTLVTSGYSTAEFEATVKPNLLAPIGAFRGWAFIFCFLSIGLTTRFRELKAVNAQSFTAFTIGVIVNVIAGYILSVHVFGDYWSKM